MKSNKVYDEPLAPVDRVAARVTAGGTNYQPACKVQVDEFIAPPPMRPRHQYPKSPDFTDLTGRTKGRFTVIGLLAGGKANTWVVRCACGTYTTRTTKSIKGAEANPAAHMDACRECTHVAYLKRNEIWRRTGKNPKMEDVWGDRSEDRQAGRPGVHPG